MKKLPLAAALFCATALATVTAHAQTASPLNDPDSIVTIQIENDSLAPPGTDEYYTSGERIGYVAPTGVLPNLVANFGHNVFGPGAQRLEIDLEQRIFTPVDTQAYNPNPDDRPYAAQLALHGSLIQDTADTRTVGTVSIGIVGPSALGQSVQNGFHSIIGDTSAKGYHYQLQDEPTLDFLGSRTWRYNLASFANGYLNLQALPQISAQVGNTEILAQGGAIIRIGSGLDSDYGPAVIDPAMSGSDAYTPTQTFVWYIFGGALGRVVAHDMLVQGNDFRSSRGVDLSPLQGNLEFGGAFILYNFRVSVTEVIESPEFHHQAPGFEYGSAAISYRF